MAFVVALDRVNRAAGSHRSPSVQIVGTKSVTIQIDAPWVEADDLCLFGIETSADNVTFHHLVSAAIYGGARSKEGGLPTLQCNITDAWARMFVILSLRTVFGIQVEVI